VTIAPDPEACQAVLRYGRPALAWEILRRDPGYRESYDRLPTLPRPEVAADPDFTLRWGLHFR